MLTKTLRSTALAAALAASSLPALPVSAQAAPWGWGWGGWGWGGFGIGLAAGLIGTALTTPYWGYGYPAYYYPGYSYYPTYGYGYGYPYSGYYAPGYYGYGG